VIALVFFGYSTYSQKPLYSFYWGIPFWLRFGLDPVASVGRCIIISKLQFPEVQKKIPFTLDALPHYV